MDSSRILALATEVREFAELHRKEYGWDRDLMGACASASYLLAWLLQQRKVRASLAVGFIGESISTVPTLRSHGNHAWVVLADKTVLDVTATQFGRLYPRVVMAAEGQTYWWRYTQLATGRVATNAILDPTDWQWTKRELSCLKWDWKQARAEIRARKSVASSAALQTG